MKAATKETSVNSSRCGLDKKGRRQLFTAAQKRRRRVAGITVTVFVCGLLLLALPDIWGKATRTGSLMEYLYSGDTGAKSDPLRLSDRLIGLELTGISDDGSVLGYTSELSSLQSRAQLKSILLGDGWTLVDDNNLGLLSFKRESMNATGFSCMFVQCIPVGSESSIVVQLW